MARGQSLLGRKVEPRLFLQSLSSLRLADGQRRNQDARGASLLKSGCVLHSAVQSKEMGMLISILMLFFSVVNLGFSKWESGTSPLII